MKHLWAACAALLAVSTVAAVEYTDHPLVSRYPDSQLSRKDVKQFDVYELIVGLEDDFSPIGQRLEGKVSRLGYYHPKDRSILEIFRNYEQALTATGMETLFTCAEAECGPAYAASRWNRMSGITSKSGDDCRYIAGKIATSEGTAFVALMVGRHRHDLHIVEVKGMQSGLVKVDADAMADKIAKTGRVAVYGIYFDTGKATLKADSNDALDQIARLMKMRPGLSIYVVGHTDGTGTFTSNMTLSQNRAEAVVETLTEQYAIAGSRLSPHGVGPLSPASTNRTDQGKGQNRRVELVER